MPAYAPGIPPAIQTTADLLSQHLLLAAAWLFWCALHSIMISPGWMTVMRRRLGAGIAYYRLFYVWFSISSLIPVLWLQWQIDSPLLWSWEFPWSLLQWTGLAVAVLLIYLGSRQYDNAFFLGIRQIRDHLAERTTEYSGFAASGILRCIRHPYYTAGILFLLFWGDMTLAHLIMKVVGIAYLLIGTRLEERKLVAEFGATYQRYQKTVPMLVPRFSCLSSKGESSTDA